MPGGKRCAVAICNSHQYKTTTDDGKPLSFFSFPKNEEIRSEWIRRCDRKEAFNPDTSRICSLHFNESDLTSLRARLLNIKERPKLRDGALPTLFLKKDISKDISKIKQKPDVEKQEYKEFVIEGILENHNPVALISNKKSVSKQNCNKCKNTRFVNKALENDNNDLQIQLYHAKIEIENLKKDLEILSNNRDDEIAKLFSKQFSRTQLDIILGKKRIVKWNLDELTHAFALRYFSKMGYLYLKTVLNYPLPGISILQRWASEFNLYEELATDCELNKNLQRFEH